MKYYIEDTRYYPKDGKSKTITLDLDIEHEITIGGGNGVFYKTIDNKEQMTRGDLWYVWCPMLDSELVGRQGYRTYQKAIEVFVKAYKEHLQDEINQLESELVGPEKG